MRVHGLMASQERRVFLEIKDPLEVAGGLARANGLFVPTRLNLPLSSVFVLALRLPNVARSIDIASLVLGRRVPRGSTLMSAGVFARPCDLNDPMVHLLSDVASGHVVDLESRIQEQTRVPVTLSYRTTTEALLDLVALAQEGAQVPIGPDIARGHRLALTFVSLDGGVLTTPHVVVRSVHARQDERSATVELIDATQRATLLAWLAVRQPNARAQ